MRRTVHLTSALVTLALSASHALAGDLPALKFEQNSKASVSNLVLLMHSDTPVDLTALQLEPGTQERMSEALTVNAYVGDFGETISFKGITPYKNITVIGMGDDTLPKHKLIELGGHAAKAAGSGDVTVLTTAIQSEIASPSAYLAKGYALRSYSFDKYKHADTSEQKDDENGTSDPVVTMVSTDANAARSLYEGDLKYVAEGIYLARDLGTEPGNRMYPKAFVDRVTPMFRNVPNVRIDILDARDIRDNNMGALWGSGRGSVHDPHLLVISYQGGKSDAAPLALVGKGITFDTGGISLKPNSNMWQMKSDLSGAAAVAGTMYAAARRGENINLVGVMPLSENMPSQDAIRPGDVLETMGGKTIEVGSTDAEGRLVLADAVQYTQAEFDPYMLLDIATLTGSAGSALGTDYAAILTRDLDFSLEMMEIGKLSGEEVWPLPLNDTHFKQIKSDIADIKSTAGRPGASIGAAVIGTFIDEDLPWVHLDIAGVDWLDSSNPTTPRGHAGWGVRFMDELVRQEAEK